MSTREDLDKLPSKELHDRAGESFERMVHETDGMPRQTQTLNISGPLQITIITPLTRKTAEPKA